MKTDTRKLWGADGRDYTIGYGRPPVETQFRKGQSGNPKGRPRGSRNIATLLDQALDQKITVTEQGRPRVMRKSEALVAALIAKALRGDVRAVDLVFRQMAIMLPDEPSESSGLRPEDLTDEELDAAIAHFLKQSAEEQSRE